MFAEGAASTRLLAQGRTQSVGFTETIRSVKFPPIAYEVSNFGQAGPRSGGMELTACKHAVLYARLQEIVGPSHFWQLLYHCPQQKNQCQAWRTPDLTSTQIYNNVCYPVPDALFHTRRTDLLRGHTPQLQGPPMCPAHKHTGQGLK